MGRSDGGQGVKCRASIEWEEEGNRQQIEVRGK